MEADYELQEEVLYVKTQNKTSTTDIGMYTYIPYSQIKRTKYILKIISRKPFFPLWN